MSQCACEIHTQQELCLDALGFYMVAVHINCDCTCSWCDGLGCKKWTGMCESLGKFSQGLACEKVNLLEGEPNGGSEIWGRKPKCAAMKCPDCGFGKPNGIPTDCRALEHAADNVVAWIRFEDKTMDDGKVHERQQVPRADTLRALWQEFMAHSGKVNSAPA